VKYQLIISDLDGTLLNDEHRILPSTENAILDVVKSGVLFATASSRSKSNSLSAISTLKDICCANAYLNGAIVETSDGEVILDNPIPDEQAFHLVEQCSAIEASFCCISEDDAIAKLVHPEAERGFKLHHGLFSEKPISHISELNAYLIVVVAEDLHRLVKLAQKELPDVGAGPIVRRYQTGLEVSFFQNNRTNKAAALRSIVNYYGIDLSKTVAIGDSIINDGPMIEAAGCGVAMKNANEEIIKKADFVTDKDNTEDGVGDFLRNLFEI